MSTNNPNSRPMFGNLQTVRHAQLLGIPVSAMAVAGAGALGFFILAMAGQILFGFLLMAVALTAAGVLVLVRLAGRTAPEREMIRRSNRKRRRRAQTLSLSGPVSAVGSTRPQGLLGEAVLIDHTTATGTPFTMIFYPSTSIGAVVIETTCPDKSLLDQSDINSLVANWALVLGTTSSLFEPELITVTTEAGYDSGTRIRSQVQAQRDRSNAVADQWQSDAADGLGLHRAPSPEMVAGMADVHSTIDELTTRISTATPRVRQRVTISFGQRKRRSEDGPSTAGPDEVGAAIVAAVPDLMAWLSECGAGICTPLTASELAEVTRCAFDPSMTDLFDRARVEGQMVSLDWDDAGPAYAWAGTKEYAHEDWLSRTLQVAGPPANQFTERALAALFTPDREAAVRRVTQFFVPFTTEESQNQAAKVSQTARIEASTSTRVSASAHQRVRQAQQTEREITEHGAVMYRTAATVTLTTNSMESLEKAVANVRRSARTGVQLSLRNTYRQTDTAFAMGLGLGLVPWKIATLSEFVRESL